MSLSRCVRHGAPFEACVRSFLEDNLPPDLRGVGDQYHRADKAATIRWQQILQAEGWLAQSWPREFGGCEWSIEQQWVFRQEAARARAPLLSAHGLRLVGPLVFTFGSPEQKRRFLPRILNSEDWWCQGFSEPGAGSDLAGLRTRAERRGDHYVVTGEKLWTTYAHEADMMFALVRTSSEGRPSNGLTFLLIPMTTPGVSVVPIWSIDGQHHFNRVVLEDVVVPASLRLGEENAGWRYARFLLNNERFGASASEVCRVYIDDAAAALGAASESDLRQRLTELEQRLECLDHLEARYLHEQGEHQSAFAAPVLKITGAELQQDAAELAVAIRGPAAAHWSDEFRRFCYARAATIYGGSNEIQKGIVSRALGL